MFPNRFRISKRATDALKLLKGKTGVTPNILCRIAFALSLRDGDKGGMAAVDLEGSEFNTSTLFGDYVVGYECLLRQVHGAVDAKAVQRIVAAHIENGLDNMKRVRTLPDLLTFSQPH